jgi:dimethylamine/trimethylamine dehydrogenase
MRVAEYRLSQLRKMPGVALYLGSPLDADEVRDFGADHVVIATGASWTTNLCGANELPMPGFAAPRVFTPNDLARGIVPEGPVTVFDFDNYYLGTAIAERLADLGLATTYVTTGGAAGAWSIMTNEQPGMHQALARRGIALRTLEIVTGFDGETLRLAQIFTGVPAQIGARSLVIVGQRAGGSPLHEALLAAGDAPASLHLTGDALAPGAIAHAVYRGHETARSLGHPAGALVARRDGPPARTDLAHPAWALT